MVKDTFGAHYNELAAFKAAEDSRRLSLPQAADAYKLELPATFQPPQGMEFKIDTGNPLWAQAQAWAHKNGLSQEAFAEGIAMIAGDRLGTEQRVTTAKNAEIAKLGTTGPARIDALTTFYKANFGEAEAGQIMSRVLTASDVALHEKMVARFSGQGGSFKGTGREPPQRPGTVSSEQYAKMSAADRLDYNRRFNQSEMPAWKDPRAA